MVYRKFFENDKNSYREVIVEGSNARHEVYIDNLDLTSTVWNLPIEKTMFKTIESLINTCEREGYILIK
jgi:hypothetical protein